MRAVQPVARGVLDHGLADEGADVAGGVRLVNPEEPAPEALAVALDGGEQLRRVAFLEQAQLDPLADVPDEHAHAITANARTGKVPKSRTLTGTA